MVQVLLCVVLAERQIGFSTGMFQSQIYLNDFRSNTPKAARLQAMTDAALRDNLVREVFSNAHAQNSRSGLIGQWTSRLHWEYSITS